MTYVFGMIILLLILSIVFANKYEKYSLTSVFLVIRAGPAIRIPLKESRYCRIRGVKNKKQKRQIRVRAGAGPASRPADTPRRPAPSPLVPLQRGGARVSHGGRGAFARRAGELRAMITKPG